MQPNADMAPKSADSTNQRQSIAYMRGVVNACCQRQYNNYCYIIGLQMQHFCTDTQVAIINM